MKKIKILFIVFLGVLNTYGQRTIIWVHGAGENRSFWETQANHFNDRQVNRNTYSQIRVSSFANDIRNRSVANNRNIAIGHSMGDVALRELDQTNPNHIGGVITFGTPLDGAPIVNAVQSGEAAQVLASVDEILARGPNAETIGFFDWFFGFFSPQGWKRYGATVYGGIILNILGGDISFSESLDFSSAALLNDLSVGGNYMERAKDYESILPKIVVYGAEDSPIHVRISSSDESDGKNDTELLQGYNTAKSAYKANAEAWQPATICLINCKKKRRISRAWRDGYEYLESGFEEDWNFLTGAYKYEYSTRTVWVNTCDGVDGNMYRTTNLTLPTLDDCYYQTTYTTVTRKTEESDGLLPRSTQVGQLSQWTKQNTEVIRADGVNHLEMGEHAESRSILAEIFRVGGRYNRFFQDVN